MKAANTHSYMEPLRTKAARHSTGSRVTTKKAKKRERISLSQWGARFLCLKKTLCVCLRIREPWVCGNDSSAWLRD